MTKIPRRTEGFYQSFRGIPREGILISGIFGCALAIDD